jgi:L-arabinokinase
VTVLFYISGHGFGHASRDVEVMNALARCHGARLLIRSAVDGDLLARTLRAEFDLMPGACDTGIVQASSVEHDDDATVETALAFYQDFDARIDAEVDAFRHARIDAIVGDIPPLAFEVAARLKVPGLAVANFTWDWIYETHPGFLPGGAGVLQQIRAAYGKATHAFELPFGAGFEVFPRVTRVPLVARRPTQGRRATRDYFGLPHDGRLALASFGGYGLPSLDLATVDCRDDWTVVTTTRTRGGTPGGPGHVRTIDESVFRNSAFRYEDLVAAVDVVVTKPGYGIIAECIAGDTAMLYTSRGAFREYDLLVSALPRYVRSQFISQADLFAGRWRESLETLLDQPDPPERLETNGAEQTAQTIVEAIKPIGGI